MSVQTITVTYYRLYRVTYPDGEDGSRDSIAGFFSKEEEAKKLANRKGGSWNSLGRVQEFDYKDVSDLPSYFETVLEWAENTLTVKEFRAFGF